MSIRVVTHLSYNKFVESWAESFLFAGISALLLLTANFFSEYWYFCFFALVPFLYKISRASPSEGLRLGFLFGISFFTVTLLPQFAASLYFPLIKIFIGTLLFSLFGWLTAWTRERWGFNPVITALLWLMMDLMLRKIGYATGIFQEAILRYPALHGFAGLFGLLFISFVIILLNSVLIWTVKNAIPITSNSWLYTEITKEGYLHKPDLFYQLRKSLAFPPERAPPIVSRLKQH